MTFSYFPPERIKILTLEVQSFVTMLYAFSQMYEASSKFSAKVYPREIVKKIVLRCDINNESPARANGVG